MAGGDRISCSSIDASGLRVSRNRLKQIAPSFLMQWPGCPRNESTAVFECECGRSEAYKVRDVYRAHVTQCFFCNGLSKPLIAKRPRRRIATATHRTDVVSRQQKQRPEYWTWIGMKSRCHNPRVKAYSYYGARGITVCDRWRESFGAFLEDMGPRPTAEHSIDRINPDGNYEPGNCRWVTDEAQNFNKRESTRINGKTILEISLETGLPTALIRRRFDAGWSYEQITATPAPLAAE